MLKSNACRWLVTVLIAIAASSSALAGITYRVDSRRPSGGDGSSWTAAINDLQTAINRAYLTQSLPAANRVTEIRVAGGRYPTTQPGSDKTVSFRLVNGVTIRGGYAGHGASDPDAFDPVLFESTLTGDLDANGLLDAGNAYCVVDCRQFAGSAPTLPNATLESFTITGGNGGGGSTICGPDGLGAGIYCPANQSPTIQNCRITGNRVNVACDPAAQNAGGGMYVGASAMPQIVNCTFDLNEAGKGGGLYLEQPGTQLVIRQCAFVQNTARETGGGGVYVNTPDGSNRVRLLNCVFRNNVAAKHSGGGVAAATSSSGYLELVNNLFDRNIAIENGGAIFAETSAVVNAINCTLAGNRAMIGAGGGVYLGFSSSATIVNGILWGNQSPSSDTFLRQIDTDGSSSYGMTYSDIEGCVSCGGTNMGDDPQFVDPAGGNYRLKPTSLSLNNGSNAAISATGVTVDLDQYARIYPTSGGTVDLGAYERQAVLNSDCNNNGIDDTCETSCAASGCSGVAGCGTALDCDGNHVPDACDIAADRALDCDGDGVLNACEVPALVDCNRNCVADAADIGGGTSTDCNANGKPDECEFTPPLVCTTNPSFDRGYAINVNHDTADQLRRNTADKTRPAPYVWMPLMKFGETIVRINAAATQPSGAILGEYYTAPRRHFDPFGPSMNFVNADAGRAAVDLDGSIWVGNESDTINNRGTVAKIGLVVGGTRVNKDGALDANGQYLKGPFQYCSCEDRDGDGLIKTSRGQGDVLPWENYDGRDDAAAGPVFNAEDECIIRYTSSAALGIRLVAIDASNNVWVGGTSNRTHQRVNGFSGAADAASEITFSFGGFNGLIDCQSPQVLWSATNEGPLVRYPIGGTADYITPNGGSFDLNIDLSGYLWMTNNNTPGSVQRLAPDGAVVLTSATAGDGAPQGVAITPIDGNIWVANSGTSETGKNVTRLDASGSFRGEISLGSTAQKPNGIAVDSFGKLWVSCFASQSIKRIDPNGGANHLGAVDLTITPNVNPGPEAYGDVTGIIGLRTAATGTWSVVHDGVNSGVQWGCIRWNTEACVTPQVPAGTSLVVEARAANKRLALPAQPFTGVSNGSTLSGLVGRFVEVRVRFRGSCPQASFATPVLCDLQIRPAMSCLKGDCNLDTFINGGDVQPFVAALMGGAGCALKTCGADMNNSGTVTSADIPCFIAKLLNPSGPTSCDNINACGLFDAPNPRSGDCNTNGVPDDNDIAEGTSPDCNHNFVPDECDINSGDPDGNGLVSADVDANGVPDECQPDCNHNSVPDSRDIAVATSHDVNYNGVPDECEPDCNHNGVPDAWDITLHTAADCNADGVPDSCQTDCDSNGVPDDCDVNPGDPDGNGLVSADCNGNGIPDGCDLTRTLFPSYDCNENGVPDECDIASSLSLDGNQNGIPDECEEGRSMGRAAGAAAEGSAGVGGGEFDEVAAWQAFYGWQVEHSASLSGMSASERFAATLDRLHELGLPEAIPWATVRAP